MNTHSPTLHAITPERGYWLHLASLLLFGAAFALLGAPVHAQDDPPGRVGRIASLSGQAWLYDVEKREWLETGVNQPLTTGDRLSIASDGRAVVQIGSTTVRLNNASELEFKRLSDEQISLNLINGGLALQLVAPEVVREVEVMTTEGEFLPRRTGHYRIDRRDGISFASVCNGELTINGPELTQTLYRGQRLELWQEGASGSRSAMHATENDAFSDWVARSQNEATRSVSQQYLSPEMTGAEDLDRYGRWAEHDDYGPVWYPVVAIGWEPYRHGRWAWVRPWGWTWIDSAPWGFAPFHYGRWISIGGRWAWAPGSRIARPVYAPALVDWPGGGSVNLSIRIGGGPPAGWVPLAPHQHYRPYYRATSVYQQRINRAHEHSPRMERNDRGSTSFRGERDDRVVDREPHGSGHGVIVPEASKRPPESRAAEHADQRSERSNERRYPEHSAERPFVREAEASRARAPAIEPPRSSGGPASSAPPIAAPTVMAPAVVVPSRTAAPAPTQSQIPVQVPRSELRVQKAGRERDDEERQGRNSGNRRGREMER